MIDPVAMLPSTLIVDAGERERWGIRISLPARKKKRKKRPARVREEWAVYGVEVEEPEPFARALVPYGEGWLAPPPPELSPTDSLRSLDYVIVDVETTGGSPGGGHRVTEVAAVRLRGDGSVVEEFSTLVNPDRAIPPPITQLTRISQSMVARAPRFPEIAAEVFRMLHGAVFVAHNASFDWRFLSWELRNAGGDGLRGRVLCTVRLARRVVPEISHRSLDALQFFFDVHNEARHRAFGDARATARIFQRLLDRVDEREITCWDQLETLLARRAPRRPRRGPAMPGWVNGTD